VLTKKLNRRDSKQSGDERIFGTEEKEMKWNFMRSAENVAPMKEDDIITYKFKGKKSPGRPRLRREVGINLILQICGVMMEWISIVSCVE